MLTNMNKADNYSVFRHLNEPEKLAGILNIRF
jgi:hypothetical protein